MLAGDEARISGTGVVRSVYDPCCGSGGMLMIAKEHILRGRSANGTALQPAINPGAEIHLFGQEVNPETWALSKSDFFMKDPTGRDARKISFGSTLSNDRHADHRFDYLIANPPYGKDWKRDKAAVKAEHERGGCRALRPWAPEDQRRTDPLPPPHAGSGKGTGGGRDSYRDHHERLPALHRRRRERRERDPQVHP